MFPFGCCQRKKANGEDSDSDEEYFPHLQPFLYRLSVLIFAIFQNGLMSGLVFGWASIDHTLLAASYNQGGTQLTVHETTAMFTWASSIGMASPLLLGVFLDRYGPRWCSVLACGIVGVGFQVFSLSQSFHGLAVGLCLIALGGPGIMASIVHISNLFPDYENLVMSLLSGSTALSFSVFTVFDALWEHYPNVITYKTLFGTYVWIVGLMAVGSYYLYPDEPYEKRDDVEYLDKEEEEEGDGSYDFAPAEGKLFDSSSTMKLLSQVDPHEKQPLAQQPPQPSPHGHKESKDGEHKVHHHQQHHHHPHLHASTISHQPSLTGIEQSLDSYLRNDDTMGVGSAVSFAARKANAHAGPTDSFRQSQWAFQSGKLELMSLKDQPFYVQLFSAMYIRSLLVFISTAYWSNFYVASISTELADQQQFPDSAQRDLTRTFTLINSMGMIGSFIVGSLLDRVGLEWCTVLTLMWGQLHVVFAYTSATTNTSDTGFMLTNFGMYMLFRNFLYPVYIASITERLGFKYFGVLLGIGFAISGVTQLSMTALDEWVQGDCHLQLAAAAAARVDDTALVVDDGDTTTLCNAGWWNPLHVIQFLQLGGLMMCPILDRWEIRNRKAKLKAILGTPPPPSSSFYGSL